MTSFLALNKQWSLRGFDPFRPVQKETSKACCQSKKFQVLHEILFRLKWRPCRLDVLSDIQMPSSWMYADKVGGQKISSVQVEQRNVHLLIFLTTVFLLLVFQRCRNPFTRISSENR